MYDENMSQFALSLHEVFERLGRIELKRMFSGHGVFRDGRMFALVVHDVLYLKSDPLTSGEFDRRQLPAFSYTRAGKVATLTSFRQAPEDLFEDRELAAWWGRLADEAALRSAHAKPRSKPRSKLPPQPESSPRSKPGIRPATKAEKVPRATPAGDRRRTAPRTESAAVRTAANKGAKKVTKKRAK